jgi:WD40 repeat protein
MRALATASADQRIKLWDTTDWSLLAELQGHLQEIWALAISPDGATLASGSKDGQVKRWAPAFKPPDVGSLRLPMSWYRLCADNKTLLVRAGNTLRLFDLTSLMETGATFTPPFAFAAVAFSPGVQLLAFGEEGGTIRFWDLPSRREVGLLPGHTNSLVVLEFSPDGKTLASADRDGELRLWDVADGRLLASYGRHVLRNRPRQSLRPNRR